MKKLAIFTIVQFEPVFFPAWLGYYRRQAPGDDIYVLHHKLSHRTAAYLDTPAGQLNYEHWARVIAAAARAGSHIIPVAHDTSFDHNWMRQTVQAFQRFLLQSYEWVLFAEIDEIVSIRPGAFHTDLSDLLTYSDHERQTVLRATGYEVVQKPEEPDLDWDRPPYLRQRSWYAESALYSKPCLSSVPLNWEPGFHRAAEASGVEADPELILWHLHKIDRRTALERAREISRRHLSAPDRAMGWGYQNTQIDDEEKLAWYFAKNPDTVHRPFDPKAKDATLIPIPEAYRDLI